MNIRSHFHILLNFPRNIRICQEFSIIPVTQSEIIGLKIIVEFWRNIFALDLGRFEVKNRWNIHNIVFQIERIFLLFIFRRIIFFLNHRRFLLLDLLNFRFTFSVQDQLLFFNLSPDFRNSESS